jgi:Predicted membrane-bound metal-dependent hydrolases
MMGYTHALGGVASLWLLYPLGVLTLDATAGNLGVMVAFAVLGALLPDLDSRRSTLTSLKVAGLSLPPVFYPFGHRGVLHSLAGWAFASCLLAWPVTAYAGWQPALALSAGWLSHLLLDCCTVTGLPLLWPKPGTVWLLPKFLRVRTATPDEHGATFLMAAAAMLLFVTAYFGPLM